MPRPLCPRKISKHPPVLYFKPRGIPMRDLKEVALATDEWEAIRLADAEGRYQMEAAKAMGVSRQTFDRIIARARRKIAEALVHGHALRIEAPLVRDSRPSQAGMNAPGETEKRAGFRISGS